uniref:glucuronosyltransferase n=1 Tax=Trichuris muris TaxID=70415 RepID=A0A5S6QIM7_TRIMR
MDLTARHLSRSEKIIPGPGPPSCQTNGAGTAVLQRMFTRELLHEFCQLGDIGTYADGGTMWAQVKRQSKARYAHGEASHLKSMLPLAHRLHISGHNITILQTTDSENLHIEVKPLEDLNFFTKGIPPDLDEQHQKMIWTHNDLLRVGLFMRNMASLQICKEIFEIVVNSAESFEKYFQNWDLLIVDNLFAQCGKLAAVSSSVPWIEYSTCTMMRDIFGRIGLYLPISAVHGLYVSNGYYDAVLDFNLLANAPNALNVFSVDYPCPAGGTLDEDYRQFVEAKGSKGTILLTVGHYLQWDSAPSHVISTLVDMFNELTDYRILWHYRGNKTLALKSHVRAVKWLPQTAILNHPKTVAFISHMGCKSFREAICARVPVIAVPFFGDQQRNTAMALRRGVAVYINKFNFTKSSVQEAFEAVLGNDSYKRNMAKLGAMLDDYLMPTDLASINTYTLFTHSAWLILAAVVVLSLCDIVY